MGKGKKLTPEEAAELFGGTVNADGTITIPPPEPVESFSHGDIEASNLTEDQIRSACVERLTEIAGAWEPLVVAVENDDRRTLTHILANLNAAAMHISDFYGC